MRLPPRLFRTLFGISAVFANVVVVPNLGGAPQVGNPNIEGVVHNVEVSDTVDVLPNVGDQVGNPNVEVSDTGEIITRTEDLGQDIIRNRKHKDYPKNLRGSGRTDRYASHLDGTAVEKADIRDRWMIRNTESSISVENSEDSSSPTKIVDTTLLNTILSYFLSMISTFSNRIWTSIFLLKEEIPEEKKRRLLEEEDRLLLEEGNIVEEDKKNNTLEEEDEEDLMIGWGFVFTFEVALCGTILGVLGFGYVEEEFSRISLKRQRALSLKWNIGRDTWHRCFVDHSLLQFLVPFKMPIKLSHRLIVVLSKFHFCFLYGGIFSQWAPPATKTGTTIPLFIIIAVLSMEISPIFPLIKSIIHISDNNTSDKFGSILDIGVPKDHYSITTPVEKHKSWAIPLFYGFKYNSIKYYTKNQYTFSIKYSTYNRNTFSKLYDINGSPYNSRNTFFKYDINLLFLFIIVFCLLGILWFFFVYSLGENGKGGPISQIEHWVLAFTTYLGTVIYELFQIKYSRITATKLLSKEFGESSFDNFLRRTLDLEDLRKEIDRALTKRVQRMAIRRISMAREKLWTDRELKKTRIKRTTWIQSMTRRAFQKKAYKLQRMWCLKIKIIEIKKLKPVTYELLNPFVRLQFDKGNPRILDTKVVWGIEPNSNEGCVYDACYLVDIKDVNYLYFTVWSKDLESDEFLGRARWRAARAGIKFREILYLKDDIFIECDNNNQDLHNVDKTYLPANRRPEEREGNEGKTSIQMGRKKGKAYKTMNKSQTSSPGRGGELMNASYPPTHPPTPMMKSPRALNNNSSLSMSPNKGSNSSLSISQHHTTSSPNKGSNSSQESNLKLKRPLEEFDPEIDCGEILIEYEFLDGWNNEIARVNLDTWLLPENRRKYFLCKPPEKNSNTLKLNANGIPISTVLDNDIHEHIHEVLALNKKKSNNSSTSAGKGNTNTINNSLISGSDGLSKINRKTDKKIDRKTEESGSLDKSAEKSDNSPSRQVSLEKKVEQSGGGGEGQGESSSEHDDQ